MSCQFVGFAFEDSFCSGYSGDADVCGGLVSVRALRGADGRLLLFGINSGLHAYRTEQKSATALAPSDWADWVQIDDNASGLIVGLAPVLDTFGAVNLFALTQNGQVVDDVLEVVSSHDG